MMTDFDFEILCLAIAVVVLVLFGQKTALGVVKTLTTVLKRDKAPEATTTTDVPASLPQGTVCSSSAPSEGEVVYTAYENMSLMSNKDEVTK